MELYARVRRSVIVEGKSERETARLYGLARETVWKMLRYSVPPGYRRQQAALRPKLDAWTGVIDQILEADKTRAKKQRHTAKRIFERLRGKHGCTGGYMLVKDYVRLWKVGQREMFVPLEHPTGDAQGDFGEAVVEIAGVERKAHCLAVDQPHSDDCFVMAFPAETAEAFLEGHSHAFAYFGEVQDRCRVVVRGLQPALRTKLDAGDQQPAVQRVDRGLPIRASDGCVAGSAHPPCPHPGNERGKLPAQGQQTSQGRESPLVVPSHPPRRMAQAASAATETRRPPGVAGLRSSRPCHACRLESRPNQSGLSSPAAVV